MDMSGGRRQPRRAQQQQQPAPFETPYANPINPNANYFNDSSYYNQGPSQGALFDDPSQNTFADPYMSNNQGGFGQPGFGSQPAPQYGMFTPNNQFGADQGFNQNQFLLQAGQQILQNQAMGFVNQYAHQFSDKSKSWFTGTLKYYFAVDTTYVLKKLMLIWFPFTQKDWAVRYSAEAPTAPRDDVNAPDLYIPAMAFVTYILVAGYLLGLGNTFSPEKLGLQASSALAWLFVEILVIMTGLYLSSIQSCLSFFHLMAYSGYKFVCMIGALLANLLLNATAYYVVLGYSILSLGFFLLRSLHVAIQTTSAGHSTKSGLHIVGAVVVFNAFIMYWLTRHLVGLVAA